MSYPGLGQDPSADTLAYWAAHDAARAAANAAAYGSPTQAAAARTALTRVVTQRTADVATQEAIDAAPDAPGFLDQLRATLTGAGKAATIGLVILGAFVFGPPLLRIVEQRGRRPARANPGRRRRRRRSRRGR